jgi:N-acetylmuramoyl-L-alanine amidase
MKIALVIGHHEKAKGAFSPTLNASEWDFCKEVVKHIPNVTVFTHNPNIGGYQTRQKATVKKLNQSNFDLVLELHFNSSDNAAANGCETLYYFASKAGRQYAKVFSQVVTDWTGIKTRNGGLKALTQSEDRGYWAVFLPKAPAILIEPFFGSSSSDCEKIQSPENMACIINDFISKISNI